MASENITLRARCHCGGAQFSFDIPRTDPSAPLKSSLCHCEDCRRSTGSLVGTWAVLPVDHPDLSTLTEYRSSPTLVRYFCGRCGANVLNVEGTQWGLALGLLESLPVALLNRVQMFVGSSKDIGAAIWMPSELYEKPLIRYSQGRDSVEISDAQLVETVSNAVYSNPEKLHASCHCEAVQFYISRPEPRHRGTKHIDDSGRRYKAAPCPCRSCRTTSGQEFISWCYVPAVSIHSPDGSPFNIDNPNLSHYNSSEGIDRTFCRTCGAKVFYRRLRDSSPDAQWDIAVGLFNDEGSRVDDWLDWDPSELAFLDEAIEKELFEAMKRGIEAHHKAIAANPRMEKHS